jgi:GDP-4-dehydro-6-deoxy-D-mannose reductase
VRFLVTGASGFIGRRLVRYLRRRGDDVAGTVFRAAREEPFDTYRTDLLDTATLAAAIEACDPEAVIHLAGLSHVGSSWRNVAEYYRVNILGTRNVLDAAGGRRVVIASSAEVYGLVPESRQPIRETEPLDPGNPYAMSKASAELLALDREGLIMRSFNLIGPGQSETFALPGFARQLAEIRRGGREPVLKVGNLEARRDFLHVDDALEAYRLVATAGEPGEAYNLGSGEAHSIREVLDLLLEVSGVAAHTEMDAERFRPVDIPLTCADTTKLRALGWRPGRSLEQALSELWESVR